MNYEHWETFITLAETNSFTRTAEKLNISQTTVTNRIKQLENQIGKLLFIRDTRSVKLSEAGTILYPFAKKGIDILKHGEFVARSFIDYDEKLAIGSLVSIWHYFLLPYVQKLKLNYSNYTLRLYTGHTQRMFQLLLDGIIDVCVVPSKPQHPDLEYVRLFEEPFYLVGSSDLFKEDVVELTRDQLNKSSFIHIPWETPFIEWFHNEIGVKLFPSIEVDDTTLYVRILLEQKMMGFLPNVVARQYIKNKELIKIPFKSVFPMPKRSIYLVHHKKNKGSRALQSFKNILINVKS
ncbi:hypothetical protein CN947_12915 [Bacillus cereus]|nr:hypothetical protein CN947_12915 [Bacillus cereus]